MSNSELEERLIELEQRLAFMDETMTQLVEADAFQARRLLRLEQGIARLSSEVQALHTARNDDARMEPPPPHY